MHLLDGKQLNDQRWKNGAWYIRIEVDTKHLLSGLCVLSTKRASYQLPVPPCEFFDHKVRTGLLVHPRRKTSYLRTLDMKWGRLPPPPPESYVYSGIFSYAKYFMHWLMISVLAKFGSCTQLVLRRFLSYILYLDLNSKSMFKSRFCWAIWRIAPAKELRDVCARAPLWPKRGRNKTFVQSPRNWAVSARFGPIFGGSRKRVTGSWGASTPTSGWAFFTGQGAKGGTN